MSLLNQNSRFVKDAFKKVKATKVKRLPYRKAHGMNSLPLGLGKAQVMHFEEYSGRMTDLFPNMRERLSDTGTSCMAYVIK